MAQAPIQGLAAMMAGGMPGGMPMGGEMENEGEEMAPCPVCMGTGMVTEDVAEAMGGGMPSGLAMRQAPMLAPMPAGPQGGGMVPPMSMGG